MMVKVVRPFRIRGEIVSPGTLLSIHDEAINILDGKVEPTEGIAGEMMQAEYFRLLSRWWELDEDTTATIDETRHLLTRLDKLYRALRQQGQNVPVRLPIEKCK